MAPIKPILPLLCNEVSALPMRRTERDPHSKRGASEPVSPDPEPLLLARTAFLGGLGAGRSLVGHGDRRGLVLRLVEKDDRDALALLVVGPYERFPDAGGGT